MKKELLTERDLDDLTTLSRTTRYRMRLAGTFPKPVQISARRVAYKKTDIEKWLQGHLSATQTNEIEDLDDGGRHER